MSESEKARQTTLEANKECYSEGNLTDQSEKKSINTTPNSLSKIKELRIGNANKVIIGNLNINSIRNKCEQLKETVLKYIDIIIVTETKLGETFLGSLFLMNGFSKSYRLDRNKNGGGVMIFIRDTISSKILKKHIFPNDVESMFVELNFRKCKWLLCGTYHPPSQSDEYFFNNLDKALDTYGKYDKALLVGSFNTEISEQRIESFLYMHELCNLVKEKTFFKNMQNPSCIDLLLTVYAFQQITNICTGLSGCHKLILTVLKTTVPRSQPKKITDRDYKQFDPSKFKKAEKCSYERKY